MEKLKSYLKIVICKLIYYVLLYRSVYLLFMRQNIFQASCVKCKKNFLDTMYPTSLIKKIATVDSLLQL